MFELNVFVSSVQPADTSTPIANGGRPNDDSEDEQPDLNPEQRPDQNPDQLSISENLEDSAWTGSLPSTPVHHRREQNRKVSFHVAVPIVSPIRPEPPKKRSRSSILKRELKVVVSDCRKSTGFVSANDVLKTKKNDAVVETSVTNGNGEISHSGNNF